MSTKELDRAAGGDGNGDGIDDVLITTVADAPMPLGNTEVRLLFGGTR